MSLLLTSADQMQSTGYNPLLAAVSSGQAPSVTANGNPVLTAPAVWATQTPTGGGPTINATITVGSATVFAEGKAVALDSSAVAPPTSSVLVTPPRTVEAF